MGDVAEVDARFATLAHEIEVEDCVTARLRFTNGALGTLAATTAAAPGFPHRVEVYGARGGVQLEGEDVVRWAGEAAARVSPRDTASASAGAGAAPTGIKHEGHTRLVTDLVAAIRDSRPPLVPGEEGRRSLELVLAIYESSRTSQRLQLR
jgi:predicted dehydrogenase